MPLSKEQTATCMGCGKQKPRELRAKVKFFCGRECWLKRRRELYWEARKNDPRYTVSLRCPVCKKNFTPHARVIRKVKYCSRRCRIKQKRKNFTEYLRQHPEIRKEHYRRVSIRKKWCGNWWQALIRDKFTCRICGHAGDEFDIRKKHILVHHLDGEWETGKNNHSIENLWTLCYDCHEGIHGISLVQVAGKWYLSGKIFERLGITEPPTIYSNPAHQTPAGMAFAG